MLLFHTLNNKEIWGGISQYQRKQHWGPLMYLTYFTPPSVLSGSRTVIVCGTPDPFTAESTLGKLVKALILPCRSKNCGRNSDMNVNINRRQWQTTAVAGDNWQDSMTLILCGANDIWQFLKKKDSPAQVIAHDSTRITLKLKGRNYSAIIDWPYVQVKYNYCALLDRK